jgi:hypothetical protein
MNCPDNRPACITRTRLDCGRRVASICVYCENGTKEGIKWALKHGFMPSHTICAKHVTEHFNLPFEQVEEVKKCEGQFIS